MLPVVYSVSSAEEASSKYRRFLAKIQSYCNTIFLASSLKKGIHSYKVLKCDRIQMTLLHLLNRKNKGGEFFLEPGWVQVRGQHKI